MYSNAHVPASKRFAEDARTARTHHTCGSIKREKYLPGIRRSVYHRVADRIPKTFNYINSNPSFTRLRRQEYILCCRAYVSRRSHRRRIKSPIWKRLDLPNQNKGRVDRQRPRATGCIFFSYPFGYRSEDPRFCRVSLLPVFVNPGCLLIGRCMIWTASREHGAIGDGEGTWSPHRT